MSAVEKLNSKWKNLRFVHMVGNYELMVARLKSQTGIESLEGADLSNMHIENMTFPEGTSFQGADLNGTTFVNCNLSGADFTGAKKDTFKMEVCSVEGVTGLGSEQIGTTFEDLMENGNFKFPCRSDHGEESMRGDLPKSAYKAHSGPRVI